MARFLILFIAIIVLLITVSFVRSRPTSELLSEKYIQSIHTGTGKFDPTVQKAIWDDKEVPLPPDDLAAKLSENYANVLGNSVGDKWIEVNLTTQHLYAHDGNNIVYSFPVSTGLPWTPTVTGTYYIWAKVRAQRMVGGDVAAGTYYNLPNVPFVQFFYGGYSLHGTYWHQDFGKPRSHGCVNLSIPDAQALYYWTNPDLPSDKYADYQIKPEVSTRIVVYGTTPSNIN